ncbi:MAG: hypothetical protein NVSMB25_18070 [Thermoleophilaceae bacterium]
MRADATALLCVLVLTAALPAASFADGHPGPTLSAASATHRLGSRVLGIGMRGTDIAHLQVLLTKRGFAVNAIGIFGNYTRAAVMRAQAKYGLAADGVVGPATLAVLRNGGPLGCSSIPAAGDNVSRWTPLVACELRQLGQPSTTVNLNAILTVIRYESAGNPLAINRTDSNARRGDPSRGLMQVIGRTFLRFRHPALSSDIFDPAANIYAGIHYALVQYGSIAAIPGVKAVIAGVPYQPYKIAAAARPLNP